MPDDIFVTCSDFCGQPIRDDHDHPAECGAPLAERKRIVDELKAKRIAAAVVEDETWRCSCGDEFTSQDDLAGHHTETQHQGMWVFGQDGDAHEVMPNESEVEVNGKPARLRRSLPNQPDAEKPAWEDPYIGISSIFEAQRAIDRGDAVLGGLPAGKKCPGRRIIDGVEVPCPHLIAMRTVETETCDHDKRHTKTIIETCFIHGILMLGENLAPAGNGPLFDAVASG